jgi:hypothetical protein
MFNENGLSNNRTDTARSPESEKRNDNMDEKDDEIAHLSILARTAKAMNCGINWHTLRIRYRHVKGGSILYGRIYVKCEKRELRGASAMVLLSATCSSAEFFHQMGQKIL